MQIITWFCIGGWNGVNSIFMTSRFNNFSIWIFTSWTGIGTYTIYCTSSSFSDFWGIAMTKSCCFFICIGVTTNWASVGRVAFCCTSRCYYLVGVFMTSCFNNRTCKGYLLCTILIWEVFFTVRAVPICDIAVSSTRSCLCCCSSSFVIASDVYRYCFLYCITFIGLI